MYNQTYNYSINKINYYYYQIVMIIIIINKIIQMSSSYTLGKYKWNNSINNHSKMYY